MTSEEPTYDEDRERIMRMARFGGLFIVLMIMWYQFGLADAV